MLSSRTGWDVELSIIEKVVENDDYFTITKEDGWTLGVPKDECRDFVPLPGDWILIERPVNTIATIIIEGRVIRNKTQGQVDDDFQQWKNNLRLKRLEGYIEHGDDLQRRVAELHPRLRARMYRFAAEGGVEFWINDAPYEMYALEGADALLRKVADMKPEEKIEWLEWWWSLNTKEHGYDYKRQMEEVPDFGDGHSSNTASFAYILAKAILNGEEV